MLPRLKRHPGRARRGLRAIGLLLAGVAAAAGLPAEQTDTVRQLIARLPEPAVHAARLHSAADYRRTLLEVYDRHHDALLWSSAGAATAPARALLELLQAAPAYGLSADDYDAERLAAQLRTLDAASDATAGQWAAFDVALSSAAVTLLHDLHFGRIDPHAVGFDLPRRRDRFDAAAYLEELTLRTDAAAVVAEVEPDFLHYRLLRQSLGRYRQLAATMDSAALPPPGARGIDAGGSYAGAPALRRLLAALGDLPAREAARPDGLIDAELSAALKRFQYLHGLREDGALGRTTWAALTVPLAQRVRQIELTLERWRWVPALEAPTLIVNIPQFRLFLFRSAVDSEADMLRMNVIVGRVYPRLHTPVFTADMNAIVFRPYWDVPAHILHAEILPLLARRPHYLESENMELVGNGPDPASLPATPENLSALAAGRLRLRQRPGPDNALGLIKFVLPNSYDVYLHSTPAQRLFAEPRRAFSHGCIRVSDPVALAVDVLRGTPGDWTAARVLAAMNGVATARVTLAQPVHVLILYGTAIASEDGAVHFFDDIYGYDRRLEGLLGLTPVTTRR
jgi:murein L,D-transpeptidase YcbB/YkuD